MNRIYANHPEGTPLLPEAREAMITVLNENCGNSLSLGDGGTNTRRYLEKARTDIARHIGSAKEEIFFTSGGTESCNWAVKGVAAACFQRGKHIVIAAFEEPAVIDSCKTLEMFGYEITRISPKNGWQITEEELEAAIRKDTILISIPMADAEMGTLQDIRKLADIARNHGVPMHVDASLAMGHIQLNVKELGVNLLSASARRFNGPSGTGFLYIRRDTPIFPFMDGDLQERDMRAGGENLAGIVGMAAALTHNIYNLFSRKDKQLSLVTRCKELLAQNPRGYLFNVPPTPQLPGYLSVTIPNGDAKALAALLERKGIEVAGGDRHHILLAMGFPRKAALSTLRITFGPENTPQEAEEIAQAINNAIVKPVKI